MPKKNEQRQLITSVYEPNIPLDASVTKGLNGDLRSVSLAVPAIISVLAESDLEIKLPTPKPKKAPCCDHVKANPTCRVTSVALSKDFSKLKVQVIAGHPCGISSIAGHICIVTYTPAGPIVVIRKLKVAMVNGRAVVDAKRFQCPSTTPVRIDTLQFSTTGLIGVRFLARIKVASCCDDAPYDTSICWAESSETFII